MNSPGRAEKGALGDDGTPPKKNPELGAAIAKPNAENGTGPAVNQPALHLDH